jgi:hypothetical protein
MKKLFTIISSVAVAALPALVHATTSSVSLVLPSDFNSNIWDQAQATFTGLNSFTEMIIGVILAVTVIEIIIAAVAGRGGR